MWPASALATGRYRAVSSLREIDQFDIAIITVPTSLREGIPDLTFIDEAGEQLAPLLKAGATVVLESTTYPGTTQRTTCSSSRAGLGTPSRTRTSTSATRQSGSILATTVHTFVSTPKVVSGINTTSLAEGPRLLPTTSWRRPFPVSSPREAELHEAPREHVPSCQHRARKRAGRSSPPISASTSGKRLTRRPPSRSGTCASPRVLVWADTACPVDPSYLSWQVKRRLGRNFQIRGAGQ